MAEGLILNRPSNDKEFGMIRADDRDCICYQVAFNVPNERAFTLFHPEFLDENGKLTKTGKTQCRQFFSYAKNREYADAYRNDLQKSLARTTPERSEEGITESRTDRVVKKLIGDVLDSIESNLNLDPEVLKDFVEVARKLNVLKDEEERIESPRRYLPVRCYSECSYRLFCEQVLANGDIIQECDYCKTRIFAEEHGWHFDPMKNLNIPSH